MTKFELVAPFKTLFNHTLGDQDSNLRNDPAFEDSVQVKLYFARFEFVLSKAFQSNQVWKRATSSKLISDVGFSKLAN